MNIQQHRQQLRQPCKRRQDSKENDNGGSIQSLLRALNLLELLACQNRGIRLSDLSELAKIPVSTVHRLLTTLESRRFVYQDVSNRHWHVGSRSLAVGAAFGCRRNLGGLAMPIMRRLHDRSAQTVNLAMVEADSIVLLRQARGREVPNGIARPGALTPMVSSALGQSVIAAMSEREGASIIQNIRDVKLPPCAALDHHDLARTIRATRVRRFAIDDEANVAGLRCVAAPIFDEYSSPIAALSIAGSTQRMETARLAEVGQEVLRAANEVTSAIGGRVPELAI